jgi:hypothetical protein
MAYKRNRNQNNCFHFLCALCALRVCVQSGEGPAACRAVRLHLNKALGYISDPSLLVVPSLALPALKPVDLSSK